MVLEYQLTTVSISELLRSITELYNLRVVIADREVAVQLEQTFSIYPNVRMYLTRESYLLCFYHIHNGSNHNHNRGTS